RAGHRCRTRAIGAKTIGCRVGVTLLDHNVIGRYADFGGNDLSPSCLVPLALALRSHAGDAGTRRMHTNLAAVEHGYAEDVAVPRWSGTNDLSEEGNADAHDLPCLAAFEGGPPFGLLCTQFSVFHRFHRLPHGGVIVAGVIFPAKRRVVGELLRFDEVL